MTPEALYRSLYRIRRAEEECCRIYRDEPQPIQSPFHSSIGQELASVAVCGALSPGDAVYASYRSHAAYLASGGDMKAFMAELFGKATGCCGGKGGSMHLAVKGPTSSGLRFMGTSAVVGQLIPVTVGFAWAQKMKKTGAVTVVFFGDGATEEGVFAESLNLAALHRIPVLFVCENNGRAICSSREERQASSIEGKTMGYRIPTARATIYGEVFQDAVDYVRSGAGACRQGPFLLEVRCTRVKEHVGPESDLDAPFRAGEERFLDPVLEASRDLSSVAGMNVRASVDAEVAEAIAFARQSPFPEPDALLKDNDAIF